MLRFEGNCKIFQFNLIKHLLLKVIKTTKYQKKHLMHGSIFFCLCKNNYSLNNLAGYCFVVVMKSIFLALLKAGNILPLTTAGLEFHNNNEKHFKGNMKCS